MCLIRSMEWYYFGRWLLLTILDYFEFWCLLKNWGVVIFHHISFLAQRPCHRICAQNKILQPTPSMAASYPCVRGGTSQLEGPRPSDAQENLYLSSKMFFKASKYGKMTVTLGHFDLQSFWDSQPLQKMSRISSLPDKY